jgi:release factor glutamine methyltransferase
MTPVEVMKRAARYLAAHGVESPDRTAELLLQHVLGTGRAGLYARREGLTTAEARAYGRVLCQRCTGTPLQYLTGRQQFLDLDLEVEPGVFVPRPETEGLVEVALQLVREVHAPTVVDVGTGTGAIALAIKRSRPDARVVATDMSEAAVTLATRNSNRLQLDVEVVRGNLLDAVPSRLQGGIDLLVSNPPYVTLEEFEALPEEVKREPYEALVGGTEVHMELVRLAVEWLAPGGRLAVEIGAGQGAEVADAFRRQLVDVAVVPDLAGRDRVVHGRRAALGPVRDSGRAGAHAVDPAARPHARTR